VREWFWRAAALRAARAHLPRPDELPGRAFEQVRLLRAVARQVSEPADGLTSGGRPRAVLLLLYRDLVYWALIAGRPDLRDAPTLAALWRQTPDDELLRAAGSAENLIAVQRALLDLSGPGSLDATATDTTRVREFAAALLRDLEAPHRHLKRVVAQRWIRMAAIPTAIIAAVLIVRTLVIGPNLAAWAPFRVSSSWPQCEIDETCNVLMVHTSSQDQPWVEFDLGKPKPVRRVDVRNRVDCCESYCIPLVVEVGDDRVHWKQVARQNDIFSKWTARFPPTPARYVRLRVTRPTSLFLEDVKIR